MPDRVISISIAGVVYTSSNIVSITVHRKLFDKFGPGNCQSGELNAVLLIPEANIPRMAEVIPMVDGQPKGIYYIDTRSTNKVTGELTIKAYDAMLKMEQDMIPSGATSGGWPRTPQAIMTDISEAINVAIDPRTVLDPRIDITYPSTGTTMREMAGWIAAVHGGNWTITDEGKLFLVPLTGTATLSVLENNVSDLDVAPDFAGISKIIFRVSEDSIIEAGDNTGYAIEADCPWATQPEANYLLTQLTGYVYRPFSGKNALINPSIQPGDKVSIQGVVYPVVGMDIKLDELYSADIEAPHDAEIDHEYNYKPKINKAVSRALANTEAAISVRFDRIEGRVESAEGDISSISQTVDGISLSVTSATGGDGKTYATIELHVGPNDYSGQILLDGNVNISGQLSADALYTVYGDMANLAVDRLLTSRRIVLYLANDTSDDNYLDIQGGKIQLVSGVYDANGVGSYIDMYGAAHTTFGMTQATNPNGLPVFWEDDPAGSEVSIGTDGYPYVNGVRIFITTERTPWPVMVYTYNDHIKAGLEFALNDDTGYYEPRLVMGEGDQNGNLVGWLHKKSDALELLFSAQNGNQIGMVARNDGYLELHGLRKTTQMDFSAWDSGYFSETIEGETENQYMVSFDGEGRPVRITDDDGHATEVIW